MLSNYLQSKGEPIDLRNNALLQIGFFGAFRRSELHAIRYEDLRFSDNGVEILIPRSKTDQGGEGQCCAIPYGDEVLCPMLALKTWCEKAEIKTGYVFRRIIKGRRMMEQPIAAQHVNKIVQDVAKSSGLPNAESYSSHSFRRGFATTASQRGASLSAIMRQGRWQHANTALGYVEEGQRYEDNAARVIFNK
jgi:integrase